MHNTSKLATAVIGLVLSSSAPAAQDLLPSEFTVLVNHALAAKPGVDRRSVTTPLMERLKTEELSENERFLKGEAHFLHLQPEESRDEFWAFRDRDDDFGRVAWQRLMIIRINAFQMVDELVETDIPRYNERFGVRADDRYGISFPIQRTAQVLAENGRADQALDLVAAHVRQHKRFDAPYTAYALPGQFFELAAEHDRADEFRALNDWVLEGLDATINQRLENPADTGPTASGISGEVFFSLFADRKLDSFEWTGEFLKLRHRIAAGAATARGTPGR